MVVGVLSFDQTDKFSIQVLNGILLSRLSTRSIKLYLPPQAHAPVQSRDEDKCDVVIKCKFKSFCIQEHDQTPRHWPWLAQNFPSLSVRSLRLVLSSRTRESLTTTEFHRRLPPTTYTSFILIFISSPGRHSSFLLVAGILEDIFCASSTSLF